MSAKKSERARSRPTRRARRERTQSDVLSPSDLLLSRASGRVLVGGRVIEVTDRTIAVADALGVANVRVEGGHSARAGDLVVVALERARGRFGRGRIVDVHRGRTPAAASEFGRLCIGSVGRNLAARALALRVVRDFFDARDFIEVETPVRVTSPGLDAHVDAVRAEDRWLVTSPELAMKRLLVGGMPRIYELSRVNRAGEQGAWHQGEFTMLEWYRAFSTVDAVIRDTEDLVAAVVDALTGGSKIRTATGLVISVTAPFERMTVREAFRRHAGIDDAAELARLDADRYFQVFVDAVEPGISRMAMPVFLTEFPGSQAGLARPCPDDDSVCERFELYLGGVELSNGFGELTDPVEQRRRFDLELRRRRRVGAPEHPIDERFLAALDEGMPPSGGNALGFDRLVALSLGANGIAPVMAFPEDRL